MLLQVKECFSRGTTLGVDTGFEKEGRREKLLSTIKNATFPPHLHVCKVWGSSKLEWGGGGS